MERNMFYIDEHGIRLPGTSRYQYHSKTSVEIFSEIKESVILESPTLRLSVAVETGDLEKVKAGINNGGNMFIGTPQNVLRRRIMRLSTGQMYSYENIEENNEKTVDQRDKICLLLMDKCPELIDFECIVLMVNQEMNSLFNYTLDYLEEHDYYQKCFKRDREDVLNSIFKDTFIEKAITLGSMELLQVFKQLEYNINIGFPLLGRDFSDLSVTVIDKFLHNLIFKLERAGYGWVQFDEINNRDRLIDKSLGRLQHGYSVILANMCDYGIDINKSLNRLDMSDYSKLDKTMLNYLIISLSNLKRKKKKTQSGVLSECLGVLVNKRISLVLNMSNAILTELVSLDLKTVNWTKQRSIIMELTQRRQHAKNDEDREWTFHQSLLDSKGRRAFSARGRGRAVVGTRSNNS